MEETDLIAQFMGTEIKMDMMGNEKPDYESWNELMPVCEKIRSLGNIDVVISIGGSVVISFDDGEAYYKQTKGMGRNSIDTIQEAVLDFIDFYNNNHI